MTDKKKSIVEEAKERFKRAEDYYQTARMQAVEDTKFALGDSDNGWQWHEEMRNARKEGNKVCLTVNLTAQHCNQIINNIRVNRPACRVMPVDDNADKKTAEILAGLIRNIQTSSAADDAHDVAAEHSIYGGEGFWRVITEYESETSFDQVITIKACQNPQLVFIDPDCKELDKSDAKWGFVCEDVNKEIFTADNPKIDPKTWEETDNKWVTDKTFRLAEYFYSTEIPDTALLLQDGSTHLLSKLEENGDVRRGEKLFNPAGDSIGIIKERPTKRIQWKWCKLVGGHDQPIDTKDWAGKYLPIIAVVGKEINIDGEVVRKGIVRDLKDPARMVNYTYSESIQTVALQNKTPYMAAEEAIKGFDDIWGTANIDDRAFLPFNAYDDSGNPLPAPARQAPQSMPTAQVQLLQLSTEEMRGASGQQNSNFGIKSEAQSGIGIQRLKQQGEMATFHFPDNLARGLRYEAVVLIDLIQKIYDTKRIVRILGLDGQMEQATLDPEQTEAYSENDIGEEDIQKIFNPTVGRYDVVIDTGPSFQTQRQEGAAALNELASKDPGLMAVAGDLIMRAQDFPMAEQLADRLAKALPPNLQDQKGGAEQQLVQLTQQAQQMNEQMQMMQEAGEKLEQENEQLKSGFAVKQMELQSKHELDGMTRQDNQLKLQLEAEERERQYQLKIYEIEFQREKADQEAVLKLELSNRDIKSAEELAELKAWVEMQKLGKEFAALNADVEKDFNDGVKVDEKAEEEAPKKKTRKKISMINKQTGAAYSGTIEEDGNITMTAPSGTEYSANIADEEIPNETKGV